MSWIDRRPFEDRFRRMRPQDQNLVWRLGAIFKQRSLRYWEGGPFGSRHRDEAYMEVALDVLEAARDASRMRESHSERSWIAIIGGPELEAMLMGPSPIAELIGDEEPARKRPAGPTAKEEIEMITSVGRRVIQL